MIVLIASETFFDTGEIVGVGDVAYWALWIGFGIVSCIVLLIFYNDGKYKATPRIVKSL